MSVAVQSRLDTAQAALKTAQDSAANYQDAIVAAQKEVDLFTAILAEEDAELAAIRQDASAIQTYGEPAPDVAPQ
jgi:hypothetical protein